MTSCAMGGFVIARHVALGLVVLGGTLGCTGVERARQCQELAGQVNPRLERVRALNDQTQAPASLREIGELYDAIATDLGPLEFQSRALARAVKDYGRHLRSLAAEARKAAEAVEAGNKTAHQSARREVRNRAGQLKTARQRIEEACR